jgi:hypothetical protein
MNQDDESEITEVIGGESVILHDLGKGVLASLAATIAVAILFVLKNVFGLLPQFDFIDMLTKLSGSTWPGAGWIMLFGGGIILGASFAILDARVEIHPGTDEPIRGVFFGVLIWLTLMVGFMPFYGGGFFAMTFGVGAPVAMLVAHVVYGWVLGAAYRAMNPENTSDE